MRATVESVEGKLATLVCAVLITAAGVASQAQSQAPGVPVAPVPVQQPPAPVQTPAPAPASRPSEYQKVLLTAGRSTVLPTDFDITRIAITNPAIADAT